MRTWLAIAAFFPRRVATKLSAARRAADRQAPPLLWLNLPAKLPAVKLP